MNRDGAPLVVILTALDLEYRAVRRHLSQIRRVDHRAGTLFEVGRLPDSRGTAALTTAGVGNTAAAVIAERAIATFRPRALLLVGVAGALWDDLALGDVVVATKVYAYHGGTAEPDGFRERPRAWESSHHLEQIARYVHATDVWTAYLPREIPAVPAVRFHPIAAGEVVLNAREDPLYRRLRERYGDAAAIEMESAGTALAGHLNESLPVLTVRGISDRADGTKRASDSGGWQPVAAANAAAFAVAVAEEICARPAARARAPDPAPTVPNQLPAAGGPLVGRVALLERLDEVLLAPAGERARIAVLTGMAGAGKTALAIHWARTATAEFPDGLLYMDVRGFGPDPSLTPPEILAGFLRALGLSRAAERGTVDERAARFRTAVSGQRALVLLDNVESVAQIRPLLPGTDSCAVLVTSRQRLRGLTVRHGATALEVDRLPEADAVALLRAVAGQRERLEWLAARCTGLPLALRIAAEIVNSHPRDDLAALLPELTDAQTTLDALDTGDDPYSAIRTVFSWSYQKLETPTATAFRRLGLHPGNTFALPAAAALLGAPAAEAKAQLTALTNAHLVQEPALGRYAMHDLLRAYARELCDRQDGPAERAAAVRRMVDQYLHTADHCGRIIMPVRHRYPINGTPAVPPTQQGRDEALRWLERERHNLVEICRLPDPDLDRARWQLAYTMRDYFYLTKYLDGWVETHELAVAATERLGDLHAEALSRNNLGRALLESERPDEAAAQYARARELFQQVGDAHGMTDALVNHASVLRRRGQHEAALGDLRLAMAYYRASGHPRKVGIALRSMARSELALGRLDEAVEHAAAALAACEPLGLALDAAQALNTLALVHRRRGDDAAAEVCCRQALEHGKVADSEYETGRSWHLLGLIARDAGDVALARERFTTALHTYQELGAAAAGYVEADLRALPA
jgi:nucleoside phosphorylase/tetratricopeptide (TPR) repeat protein